MKTLSFLIILVSLQSGLFAQNFSLSGELRPRSELRHGYRTLPGPDDEPAAFVNQRTRISLLYETERFNTFISFQDVRTWGGKGMFDVQPGTGIHQAFVEIPFLNVFSAKIGRQEIRYNNQRLFGVNNWNQAGRTHDAALLKFAQNDWLVHLGTSFNQTSEPNFGTIYLGREYKSLNFIWLERKVSSFTLNGFFVADGFQVENNGDFSTVFRHTYGGILTLRNGGHIYELHTYLQSGINSQQRSIRAWYVSPVARFKLHTKLNVNVGAEIFSGNNLLENEAHSKVFDPLYGANHAFNGRLDYFTNFPVHTGGAGLVNPFVNIIYQFRENIQLRVDYHYFAFQNNFVNNQDELAKKYLGSEIDMWLQFDLSKLAELQVGYSTMFASESMEMLKGGSNRESVFWGWVMLTVRPEFFSSGTERK